MSRRSSDREAIEVEIDRIRSLGLDELRTLWRTTFRSSVPAAFSKDLTARFICWHIHGRAIENESAPQPAADGASRPNGRQSRKEATLAARVLL